MPTLNWIGKETVINHHKQVPYHLLRANESLSAGVSDCGNLLVQGDNLSPSFWFQTASDKFYPDFVAKLKDGRILVIESKGEHLWSNDDSKEKRAVGELWADRSKGRCLFVMPKGKDWNSIRKVINK